LVFYSSTHFWIVHKPGIGEENF